MASMSATSSRETSGLVGAHSKIATARSGSSVCTCTFSVCASPTTSTVIGRTVVFGGGATVVTDPGFVDGGTVVAVVPVVCAALVVGGAVIADGALSSGFL